MSVLAFQALDADYTGPMDWDLAQENLFNLIVNAFENHSIGENESVIWGNQDIPQPAYPYVSMTVISGPTPDSPLDEQRLQSTNVGNPGETLEERTQGPRSFTLSVSVHTDEVTSLSEVGTSLLGKLQAHIGRRSVMASLWGLGGLSVVRVGTALDTSLVINGSWISRGTMDIVFRIISLVREDIGFIESAVVEGKTTSDSGNVITTTTTIDIDAP